MISTFCSLSCKRDCQGSIKFPTTDFTMPLKDLNSEQVSNLPYSNNTARKCPIASNRIRTGTRQEFVVVRMSLPIGFEITGRFETNRKKSNFSFSCFDKHNSKPSQTSWLVKLRISREFLELPIFRSRVSMCSSNCALLGIRLRKRYLYSSEGTSESSTSSPRIPCKKYIFSRASDESLVPISRN